MRSFEVDPGEQVRQEIEQGGIPVDQLVGEAIGFLDDPDVDDVALARMFIERGYSEEVSYWLVRESEVRRAPKAR